MIKPVQSTAVVANSSFVLPDDAAYEQVIKATGVSKYTAGTQEQRTAEALKLVQKYYPEASATNPVVKINGLHSTSPRRISQGQLAKAALAKGERDSNLHGRQEPCRVFEEFREHCTTPSTHGELLHLTVPEGHEGDFGGYEDAAEQDEKQDEEELTPYVAHEHRLLEDCGYRCVIAPTGRVRGSPPD